MARRLESVGLAVEHVRDPGDWMPVCCGRRCESPDEVFTAQTGLNLRVAGDVDIVVVANKLMFCDLQVNSESDYRQQPADDPALIQATLWHIRTADTSRIDCCRRRRHCPETRTPARRIQTESLSAGILHRAGTCRAPQARGSGPLFRR